MMMNNPAVAFSVAHLIVEAPKKKTAKEAKKKMFFDCIIVAAMAATIRVLYCPSCKL